MGNVVDISEDLRSAAGKVFGHVVAETRMKSPNSTPDTDARTSAVLCRPHRRAPVGVDVMRQRGRGAPANQVGGDMSIAKIDTKLLQSRLAGVLPYQASLFRQTETPDGRLAHTYQASFLGPLINEYLRLGATRIAVPADDPTTDWLHELSSKTRSHVVVIDQDNEVLKRVQAFMDPIVDEVPVRFTSGDYFPEPANPQDPAAANVIAVRRALRRFLLGIRYRLQVDLDLDHTRKSLEALRASLTSQDALVNIHRFLGILNSYELKNINSLEFVSDLAADRVREFEQLLDDELFHKLSRAGYFLGIPGMLRRAMWAVQRVAADIVKVRAKPLLKIAATPVNVATGGFSDVSAIADLLPEGKPVFLPPLAWFSSARMDALKRFESSGAPVEPDYTKQYVIDPRLTGIKDPDFLEKLLREKLGGRLLTRYEDGESNEGPDSEKE